MRGPPRFLGTGPTINPGGAEGGAASGGASGSGIGTAILPGFGTVAGGFIGSIVGAWVGGFGASGGSASVQAEVCLDPNTDTCTAYVADKSVPGSGVECLIPGQTGKYPKNVIVLDSHDPIPNCLRDVLLPKLTTLNLGSLIDLLTQPPVDYANSHIPYQALDAAAAGINAMPYPSWPEWAEPSNFAAGNVQNAMMSYWMEAYEQYIVLGLATGTRSPNEVAKNAPYPFPFPYALGTRVADGSGTITTSPAPSSQKIAPSYTVPKTVGPTLDAVQWAEAVASLQKGSGPSHGPVKPSFSPHPGSGPSLSPSSGGFWAWTLGLLAAGGAVWAGVRWYEKKPLLPASLRNKLKKL